MIDSPLVTSDALAPPAGQPQYSPAFLKADADMEKLAGDKVPQSLRYQYWQAINGDKLAKIDPRSAALAYDTSIMTSPQKAFELVKQTGGDPTKMYQARNVYAQQLVAQDPAKYQPMMDRWTQHNTALGQSLGLVPAASQQRQGSPTPAAAPAAAASDEAPKVRQALYRAALPRAPLTSPPRHHLRSLPAANTRRAARLGSEAEEAWRGQG